MTTTDAASTGRRGWRARVAHVRAKRGWRILRWPLFAATALGALGVLAFVVLYLTVKLPKDPPMVASSRIVDDQGRELAVLAKDGYRVQVPLEQVAPVVKDALLSSEDRRFYEHGGIDPIGTMRAFVNDVRGGNTQGGSTLTQQLVKNSYLTSERSVTRKVKEAILAIKLDRQQSKDEILSRYLNTVYFGRGAYGVEAAAKVYFDATAKDLTTEQAALLVGELRAPELAEPARHPDEATARRNRVLDAMVSNGKLSQAEADRAKAAPLGTVDLGQQITLTSGVAPHFVEWIRQQAIAQFGEATVYGGGLTIRTTLDIDQQRAAEQAITSVLDQPDDPQAALVGVDKDGAIRAYVGGRDFANLKVDLARGRDGGGSGRQAGSTFKPFGLAAALEKGIGLGTAFPGPASLTLTTPGGPWKVQNYGDESFGNIDLTTATANSVNTVYAQLALKTGAPAIADVAKKAGITSPLEANPSIVLGAEEVSPLDMADAYLTFAREGERVAPYAIAAVEDRSGRPIFKAPAPKAERAMAQGTAQAVSYALQQVVARGTGKGAQIDRPMAGKTGTTQDYGDAWFAGYTPSYAAVVWVGYPEGAARPMKGVHGIDVTGGTLPAQIWKAFAEPALANVPKDAFTPPPANLLGAGTIPPDANQQLPGSDQRVQSTSSDRSGPPTTAGAAVDPTTTTPARDGATTTTAPPATQPPKPTTTTAAEPPPTTAAAGGGSPPTTAAAAAAGSP